MSDKRKTVQDKNKKLILAYHEDVWSQGKENDELYVEDFTYHFVGNQKITGKQDMRYFIKAHRAAFPDWKEEVMRVLAEGERVLTHYRATGTHEGEFMGIPATGNKVDIDGFCISRVWNGKIVEQWGAPDILKLRGQVTGEEVTF